MQRLADSPVYEPGVVDPGLPVSHPTSSFWLQDAAHQPVNQNAWVEETDFVIIGSGITAASVITTLHKLQPSASIVLVDARQLCGGASGRNGGHIKPSIYTDWLDRKARYGLEETIKLTMFEHSHLKIMTDYIESSRVACDLRIHESVDAYFDHATFREALDSLADMRTHLPEIAAQFSSYSDSENLSRLSCSEACVGAVVSHAASLWPSKLVTHILSHLADHGVTLYPNAPVNMVLEEADHAVVVTSIGKIRAKHVVHATNGYLGHLLPEIRPFISPVRGNVVLQAPSEATKFLGRSYWFRYNKFDFDYMIQRPDGHFVIGRANTGRRAVGDDSSTDLHTVAHLGGILPQVLTWKSSHINVKQSWSGILGFTRDGLPLVGRAPRTARQWVCAGFCGLGMIRAWRSADALAHLIVRQSVPRDFPTSMLITDKRLYGEQTLRVSAKL